MSPEYIKQCEKAEDIQRSRPPIVPVTLYRFKNGIVVDELGDNIASVESDDCVLRYKYIWFPRQDQLQEMFDSDWQITFAQFIIWMAEDEPKLLTPANSMEQLWLAFVMAERYNKIWLTEKSEWVNQPK